MSTKELSTETLHRIRNSPMYAELKRAEAAERLRKRRAILADLREKLPPLEQQAQRAAQAADKAWSVASEATTKARAAAAAASDAQSAALGLGQVVENAKGRAWGAARELDDPRIGDLHRWLIEVHAAVRAGFRVTGLRDTAGWTVRGPTTVAVETTNATAIVGAADRIKVLMTEVDELSFSDYGDELCTTLRRIHADALDALRPVERWVTVAPHRIED